VRLSSYLDLACIQKLDIRFSYGLRAYRIDILHLRRVMAGILGIVNVLALLTLLYSLISVLKPLRPFRKRWQALIGSVVTFFFIGVVAGASEKARMRNC
jgi:hypothetical protein